MQSRHTFSHLVRGLPAITMAALLVGGAILAGQSQGQGRGLAENQARDQGEGQGGRGQGAPNQLGQPLVDAKGNVRDEAVLRAPLLPEDAKYRDIDGRRMKAILMEVDAISLKDRDSGRLFWGRNVGTPGHVATQDWVEAYFRKNGLKDIHRQPLDLNPQWVANSWDISFTSGGKTFKLNSVRPPAGATSTPPAGLEFELAWVGAGTTADFVGRDVRGKAVLMQDLLLPGDLRHSVALDGAIARAFQKGAAAVGVVFGISDNFAIWTRVTGGPGFNIGYEDSKVIRDLLGDGQRVTMKYRMDSRMVPNLKTAHVWGTLPGTGDENVTIIAHMDGYFQSALDNGSGLAVMMGLVEHYAKIPQSSRRRGIRFMASAGHHGGPGARWLHDNLETPQGLGKTALAINLEHVAVVRTKYWGHKLRMTTGVSPMRWWVWGSPRLLDITRRSFNRFNVATTADMDPGASGEMGSLDRDVPSMQVISSPEIKHTEQDTPEWVPAAGLEQVARAYAKIIDDIDTLERAQLLPAAAR